jgi:hypothetical protein
MKTPAECVSEFFEANEWTYDMDATGRRFRSQLLGKHGCWSFSVALCGEEKVQRLVVLSIIPAMVPEARRAACADLLNRINAGMEISCLELDPETGAVRCRAAMPVDPDDTSPVAVAELILTNLAATDHFFAPIMRLVYAGQSPGQALRPEAPADSPPPRLELN